MEYQGLLEGAKGHEGQHMKGNAGLMHKNHLIESSEPQHIGISGNGITIQPMSNKRNDQAPFYDRKQEQRTRKALQPVEYVMEAHSSMETRLPIVTSPRTQLVSLREKIKHKKRLSEVVTANQDLFSPITGTKHTHRALALAGSNTIVNCPSQGYTPRIQGSRIGI